MVSAKTERTSLDDVAVNLYRNDARSISRHGMLDEQSELPGFVLIKPPVKECRLSLGGFLFVQTARSMVRAHADN